MNRAMGTTNCQRPWRAATFRVAALSLAFAVPAFAQDAGGGGPGPVGTADIAGATIDDIQVTVAGATSAEASAALQEQVLSRLGFATGDRWSDLLVSRGLDAVRNLPGVADASFRVDRAINPQRMTIAITVTAGTAASATPGVRFPVLHRGERSFLKVLANGGFGLFSDSNPWFRNPATFTRNNPLVQNPAVGADTGKRASWTEMYAEYGLGGVTPLGRGDLYLYGAATVTTAVSIGRDIFRDDARSTTAVEKLYAGLLYAPKQGTRVNLSVGRQNFTLNEGFLIGQYGVGAMSNAGPRPGIYLAPRTTQDMSAFLTIKSGKLTSTSFYLDPNEYEPIESNTKLAGTNLKYAFDNSTALDISYINIVGSDSKVATPGGPAREREGTQTLSGHLRWADADVLPGLWVDGELAHQWNSNYAMNAWAGYGLVGYLAREVPWTPSISYRFSSHSGDDPNTQRFERFDPLFSGGLGEWLQGITINKPLTAANRQGHRIRTNVAPNPRLNLTLDLFFLRANQLNNRGGNPALADLRSRDLGREIQFVTRWAVSRRVYFVGIVSHAIPGEAIRLATTDPARPWTSLQAQFYFTL